MCEVHLNNVVFGYGNDLLLDKINLTVPVGRFLVIVGPNGGGKSTLIRLIAGLLKPQGGHISINRTSVSEAQRSGVIAYVPQHYSQNTSAFPATVQEVVAMGLVSGRQRKISAESNHIVDRMLDLVDVSALKDKRIGELSGGQQQRVMVARALAGNPQLLLLDEPTSGVDYAASERIFELLNELHRNLGLTIVMVSHDIERAVGQATDVACINRGLCFYGPSAEFRENHLQSRHFWY